MVIQSLTPARPQGAAPPTFERVPQNCRFVQGGNASFELKVRGNPRPQVVWTRRGAPIVSSDKYTVKFNEQTGESSLLISRLQKEDEGEYTCSASNQYGEAVCNVLIQTDGAPAMRPPQGVSQVRHQQLQQTSVHRQYQQEVSTVTQQTHVVDGKTTTVRSQTVDRRFAHSGSYEGEPGSPQYYTNGTDESFRVDTFEYRLLREIDFRESKTKRHPGEPETEVETDAESKPDTSPPSAPQVTQRMRNSKLLEGSDATFQAKISGSPKPNITWFRNGQRIRSSQRCKMTFKNSMTTLHIHMALPEDAGFYTIQIGRAHV